MTHHVVPVRTYVLVFAALLLLTAATVLVSGLELGPWHLIAALAIAVVKALLVALFFMHILYSPRLIWVVVIAAIFWLGILVMLTLSDYLSRGWIPAPGS